MITESKNVMKVPSELDPIYAASISVNPRTSYLLLKHFVNLKKGDVIIQNGGNSMVGMGVIQMAREMGVKTINVISATIPNGETTLRLLTNLGGDINIFDRDLETPLLRQIISELPPIQLGFNNIGGESAVSISRVLADNGTLVTYGGMSKHAPVIPLDVITDKSLNLKGFWLTYWSENASKAEKEKILSELSQMVIKRQLSYFFNLYDFDDMPYALTRPEQNPHDMRKIMMCMQYPDRFAEHDKRPLDDYDIFVHTT